MPDLTGLLAMLRTDPGFRVWVNRLLALFWLGVAVLAATTGWFGSLSLTAVLIICAASQTIWRVVTRGRREPRAPRKQIEPGP
jgi:hypothetical protein